jgi:hypothetical protein
MFSLFLPMPLAAHALGGASHDDVKKHLSAIDAYLSQARSSARLLYQVSGLPSSGLDPTIVREDLGNLDMFVASADKHLSQLRSMSNPPLADMAKLDALARDLLRARSQLSAARSASASRTQLRDAGVALVRALETADDDFAEIATSVGLTRLDDVQVAPRQPVRGREDLESPMPNERPLPHPTGPESETSPHY